MRSNEDPTQPKIKIKKNKKEQTLRRKFANLEREETDVGGDCHGYEKIRVQGGRQILIELLYTPGTVLGSEFTSSGPHRA